MPPFPSPGEVKERIKRDQQRHGGPWVHKTKRGRVVYNRKKKYFSPTRVVKIVENIFKISRESQRVDAEVLEEFEFIMKGVFHAALIQLQMTGYLGVADTIVEAIRKNMYGLNLIYDKIREQPPT